MVVVDQPITNPISGPSFDLTIHYWPWAWQYCQAQVQVQVPGQVQVRSRSGPGQVLPVTAAAAVTIVTQNKISPVAVAVVISALSWLSLQQFANNWSDN